MASAPAVSEGLCNDAIPENQRTTTEQTQSIAQSSSESATEADNLNFQEQSHGEKPVGTIIAKAKRAAASLWTVLHAQGCRDPGCTINGCLYTKKLLLHVKTCPAGPNFKCPAGYNGCDQARKLLSHYRRCREMRSKQTLQQVNRRGVRQAQHVCLVCSLVARRARTALEPNSDSSSISKQKQKRSFETPLLIPNMIRSTSETLMPPPPPRPPGQTQMTSQTFAPMARSDTSTIAYGSPPSKSQLMVKGIQAVAYAASPAPGPSHLGNAQVLGKSFDSSRRSTMSHLPHQHPRPTFSRPRAESFDERRRVTAISLRTSAWSMDGNQIDPTNEATLLHGEEKTDEDLIDRPAELRLPGKMRSSSCGLLSSLVRRGGCDTIAEEATLVQEKTSPPSSREGVGYEEPFSMD